MPLIRTLETIRVPPRTHIDLTIAQYDVRAHRVVAVGFSKYEDRLTVSGLETLEFKRGEVLGIENLGKDLTGRIEILDPEAEAPESEANTGAEASAPAPEQPTVEEAAPPASADAPSADEAETTGAESAAPVAHKSKPKKA